MRFPGEIRVAFKYIKKWLVRAGTRCLVGVLMVFGGEAGVRVPVHGLNFPLVPKKGALDVLISLPRCREEGMQEE